MPGKELWVPGLTFYRKTKMPRTRVTRKVKARSKRANRRKVRRARGKA